MQTYELSEIFYGPAAMGKAFMAGGQAGVQSLLVPVNQTIQNTSSILAKILTPPSLPAFKGGALPQLTPPNLPMPQGFVDPMTFIQSFMPKNPINSGGEVMTKNPMTSKEGYTVYTTIF